MYVKQQFYYYLTAPGLPGERRLIVESHSKVVKYFPLAWRANLIDRFSPGSRILSLLVFRRMSVCVHAFDVFCE